jgi:hypothetical protein
MTNRLMTRIHAVGCSLIALAGCGGGGNWLDRDVATQDAAPEAAPLTDARADRGPTDAAPAAPILLAVRPDHGPFRGGTEVTLRGSNFTEDMVVRFGDAQVQPRNQRLVDSHRLVVATPAGRPGVVDVSIERGDQRSRIARAFTYDSFYADPSTGSIAGGTRITLHGQDTMWTAATTVMIDASPCENLTFVSPNELSCTVPAHAQGDVPITVTTGAEAVTVANAFTYYEASDPNSGGFGGGPIRGSINVAVLDQMTGDAIPNAVVYLGNDPNVPPPTSGLTNMRGQVTLSAPDLRGPVTITASAHCHASTTFVSIDGRDATIFLMPWLNRVPGVDCGMGMPPDGTPRPPVYAATVEGELVWAGPREFGPNPWNNIPMPRANERRVAYVMTTVANILSGNPDPGMGGIVLEQVPENYGGRGYAYSIVARPSAMAVYAIAGLERTDTTPPRFTPYVMGVARSVLGAPRARLVNVDIDMNIPLDHELTVQLENLPPQVNGEPNRFRVENWIDLGGEGVIPRPDVAVNGRSPTDPYRIVAQPAFLGTLADARMIVRATYGTGTLLDEPSSTVLVAGITSPDDTIRVRNWVGIPRILEPMDGGTIPATRRLRIEQGGADPDMFWSVISQAGSSCRVGFYLGDVVWWQHHFPGNVREIGIPDISMIPTLTDIPRGIYQLSVCGFRVAGFDYNNFRYQYLSQYYWTAFATNSATLAR